jgi:hypothetical protein
MHTLVLLLGLSMLSPSLIDSLVKPTAIHDFHVSKCLIEYNTQASAIQISLHVFIDDTEEALKRLGAPQDLYICTEKEHAEAEQQLADYLIQHLRLEIDGKLVAPSFLGKEVTEDLAGMWCYLEITDVKDIQHLTITNEVLMDAFDDQKNIVNVIGPGNQKGMFLFQKGESKDSITWKSV